MPDLTGITWQDNRVSKNTINNNQRFLSAANALYMHYAKHLHNEMSSQALTSILQNCMGKAIPYKHRYFKQEMKKRIQLYKAYCQLKFQKSLPKYCKLAWQLAAITEDDKDEYIADENFYISDWYKFQEAAKHYKNIARERIKNVQNFCDLVSSDEIGKKSKVLK